MEAMFAETERPRVTRFSKDMLASDPAPMILHTVVDTDQCWSIRKVNQSNLGRLPQGIADRPYSPSTE